MKITENQMLAAMKALGDYDRVTGLLSGRRDVEHILEAVLGPCEFPTHHAQTYTVVGVGSMEALCKAS